ncbi:hypothetical protein NFC79_05480 [Providencia stuartii]|nr:hypothetical protein NFC79_05480 [Providencia stuartii]
MRLNIYLIFPLLLFSCAINANNRPGFVCGKFNGNVVEVPREYVDFIAEYEGYSYFDRRAINNKKGCDANFTVLPLRMTWPEMKPVDRIKTGPNEEEIKIAVKPLTNSNATMNKFRDNSINNDFFGKRSSIYYDDELDLYFVEYDGENNLINENDFYQKKRRVYWFENNNEVIGVIRCDWVQVKNEYYFCDINGRIPEIDAYFQTDIKWSQIRQWERILVKSKEFVINHLK